MEREIAREEKNVLEASEDLNSTNNLRLDRIDCEGSNRGSSLGIKNEIESIEKEDQLFWLVHHKTTRLMQIEILRDDT